MTHRERTRRIVIIGAGPGGLALAMLMASAGAAVTVLERRDSVGGRSSRVSGKGYAFDRGPTFFLYPRVLQDIFTSCGRRLSDEVELIRLDPMYRLVFEEGGEIRATADVDAMAAQIAALSPGDAGGLRRFLADNEAKLAAFRPILERGFAGPRDLLAPPVVKALRWLRPWQSVDQDLRRYFGDPRVRLAFSFQSKYLGMSPYKCPSLFTILAYLEYGHGVFHPRGGTAAVMDALARVACAMGVDIRLGEAAERVRFAGRRAVGVDTARGAHRADAVVVNADFAHAISRLVPDALRRRWSDARLARKRYSCSTFMLYLGLDGRIDHLDHHTILLAKDYARNLSEIEGGTCLPGQPSLYVQNACVTDPHLAPPGGSTLYVLVPVSHQRKGIDWARERPRFRALVLKRLKALGLADIERRIRFEQIVTPADWEHDMHIHRGSTFNLAHTLDQMLHNRPRNRFDDVDGVYLVGGGTHPGSGLPVIFEGARITARLIADELGLALPDSRRAAIAPLRPAPIGESVG